jgi:hypothetical protein
MEDSAKPEICSRVVQTAPEHSGLGSFRLSLSSLPTFTALMSVATTAICVNTRRA